MHLPLTADLRPHVRLGAATVNEAIEIVSDPDQATYFLVGRLSAGGLEYAWVRPDVARGDQATSSLPLRTRWLALGEDEDAPWILGRELENLALRLGKIRAWLTLASPREGFFPYRLALKNGATQKVKLGDQGLEAADVEARPGSREPELNVDRRLVKGERYGVTLRADPEQVAAPVEPRYVYAFFIDSSGPSTMVFPRGQLGSVENHLGAALFERRRGEGGGTAGWASTAEPRHSGRQAVSPLRATYGSLGSADPR
ncbi:MAG: hypothetical protein GY842_02605 [bacterium]|nr:hypothetical protein [bacterium]